MDDLRNLPFRKFQPQKRLPKTLGDLFRVKICLKWAIIALFGCSKNLGEACEQEVLQQCPENSRSQIVFRTDIFQKLSLGAPGRCCLIQPIELVLGKSN